MTICDCPEPCEVCACAPTLSRFGAGLRLDLPAGPLYLLPSQVSYLVDGLQFGELSTLDDLSEPCGIAYPDTTGETLLFRAYDSLYETPFAGVRALVSGLDTAPVALTEVTD